MKKMRKVLAFVLAMSLVFGSMVTAAFAETGETVFNKDNISREITAGTDGYTFQSVYGPAYEMSNHMVTNNGVKNEIPQTLILVEADEDYTWAPDGKYVFGQSNYEVLYCCDAITGYEGGIHYKRLNLEDSAYYDAEEAAHIRSIVSNSYPFISLDQMKADLAAEGFEGAADLTRADVITAVQSAIWSYANNDIDKYVYSTTFDVPSNPQWGGVLHDYTNEMEVWWKTGKRQFTPNETVGARINALAAHLKAQTATYPEKHQIVITGLEIIDATPVQEKDGVLNVILQVELNNSGSSEQDAIDLSVFVDGTEVKKEAVEFGKEVYTLTVEAKAGQTIETVVSGTQILPTGAYFYEPVATDSNQDGIATNRETSQSLVGVAGGETNVYAAAEVTLPNPEVPPVSADLTLQKVNELGEALTGAEFTLSVVTDAGKIEYDTYAVDENGKLIVENLLPGSYELAETTVPEGYVAPEEAIAFTVDENGVLTVSESNYATLGEDGVLTVVNEVAAFSISGSKTWNDEDDKDGIRPEIITINLLADGVIVDTKTVTEADGWTWTFEGLDKYADGKEVVYTITEDAVEGYETVVNGYDVTNTHTPEKELPPDENVIDEEEPTEEPKEEEPVVEEEDPKQELPEDENIIDEPVVEEETEEEPVVEEETPKQELPEDENIIDEPVIEKAPDTGDHAPIMMLMLIAAISLAGMVTLSYRRK